MESPHLRQPKSMWQARMSHHLRVLPIRHPQSPSMLFRRSDGHHAKVTQPLCLPTCALVQNIRCSILLLATPVFAAVLIPCMVHVLQRSSLDRLIEGRTSDHSTAPQQPAMETADSIIAVCINADANNGLVTSKVRFGDACHLRLCCGVRSGAAM